MQITAMMLLVLIVLGLFKQKTTKVEKKKEEKETTSKKEDKETPIAKIGRVKAAILNLKSLEIDFGSVEKLILEAKNAIDSGDNAKGALLADKSAEEFENCIEREIQKGETIIEILESFEEASEKAKNALGQCKIAYEQKKYKTAVDIARQIWEAFNDRVIDLLGNAIKDATKAIEDVEKEGFDVCKIKEEVEKSKKLLSEKKLREVYDILEEIEKKLDELKVLGEKLNSRLGEIRTKKEWFEKMGCETKKYDEGVESITKRIKEKKYSDAEKEIEKLEIVLEEDKKELNKIKNALEGLERQIVNLSSKNITCAKTIEGVESAKCAIKKLNFEEAKSQIKASFEALKEAEEKHNSVYQKLEKVRERVENSKKHGGYSPDGENILKEAYELHKKMDYDTVFIKLDIVVKLLDECAEKHKKVEREIAEAKGLIEESKRSGGYSKNAVQSLQKSMECLLEWDYGKASIHAKEAIEAIKTSIEKYKRASEILLQAERRLKATNGKPKEAKTCFQNAKEQMSLFNYDSAFSLGENCIDLVSKFEEKSSAVISKLDEASKKIEEMKSLGCENDKINGLLSNAAISYEEDDIEKSMQYAQEVIEEAEKHIEKFKSAQKVVLEVESEINDALSLGAPVKEIYDTFNLKVKEMMKNQDYENALKEVKMLVERANTLTEEPAKKRLEETKVKIEEIYATGFESEEAMLGLEKAEHLLEEKKYLKLYIVASRVAIETEEAFHLCQQAAEKLLATQECLDKVRGLGGEVSEVEKLLAEGESHIVSRDYKSACEISKKAYEVAHEVGLGLVNEVYQSAKSMVELAEKMKADTTRSKPFLEHCEKLIETNNFDKARDMAIVCKQEAKWAVSQLCSERASKTSNALSDAKLLGVDCKDIESRLMQANDKLSNEEFEEAYDILEACYEEIGDLVRNRLADELTKSANLIEIGKKFGVEVSQFKVISEESEKLMEEGEFRNAKKKIEECIYRLETEINIKIAGMFLNGRAKIDDAKYFSVNVERAERIIENARTYVDTKEYEKILDEYSKFEKEVCDSSIRKVKEITKDGDKIIKILESFHFDVTEPKNMFLQSEKWISELKIREGFELGIKGLEIARGLLLNKIKETTNQVEREYMQAQDIGVREDLKGVEVGIQDMKLFFQNSEWEEGFRKAEECRAQIKESVHSFLSLQIDKAQTLITTYKLLGGDISTILTVDKPLEELEAGDYVSCQKNIKACIEHAESAVIHIAAVRQSKLEEKVDFARRLGVDCTKANSELSSARVLVERGEYEKFIVHVKKCEEELVSGGKILFQNKLDGTVEFISNMESRLGQSYPEEIGKKVSAGLEEASKIFSDGDLGGALSRLDLVKSLINESLQGLAGSVFTKLEEKFSNAQSLGASEELKGVRKQLDELRGCIDSKEYWKVLDAEKEIDKEISNGIARYIAGKRSCAKVSVQWLVDFGLDVETEKGLLEEGEELVLNGDYKEALLRFSKCETISGERARKKSEEILEWLNSCKEVAAEIDLDPSFVEKLYDSAKDAMGKKEYGRVNECKKDCESGLRKGAEEKHRTVKAGGEAMIKIIDRRNLGVGTLSRELETSDKMMNKLLFKEALSIATDVVFRAKEILDDAISKDINTIEESIEETKLLGCSIDDAKEFLERAKELHLNMDYEGAFEKLDESKATLKKVGSAKVEEEQKRANVLQLILGKLVKEKTDGDADLEDSKKLFSEYKFKSAYEKAVSACAKFETLLKSRLAEEIRLGRNELAQSNALGVGNLEGYKETLDECESLLNSGNYEDCYFAVSDTRKIIDTKIEEQIRIEIENAREVLTTALKFKIKSKKADELLEDAENKMERKEYPEAKVLARLAAEECNKQVKIEAQETLELSRNVIASSAKMGVDMKKAQKMLERAEKLFWESNYLMVFEAAKNCIEEAQNTVKDYIARLVTECGNMITSAGNIGIDVKEYTQRLGNVETLYVNGDYGKAMKDGIALLEEVVKGVRAKCEVTFEEVRKGIAEAETDGYKLSKTAKYLEAAKKEFESKKLVSAAELAMKSEKSLHDEREEIWIDAMMDAKQLIEEAKNQKFSVPEAEELLGKSKLEYVNKNYKNALEIAKEAKKVCNAAFGEYKKAFDAIDEVQKLLENASKICDVKQVKRAMRMATQAMGANDYAKAYEIAKACEKELEKLQYKALAERLKVCGAEVGEIIAFGVEAEDIKKLLVDARNYIKDKAFMNAHECLEAVSAFVAREHSRRNVLTALKNAEDVINERKKKGFDMTTAIRMLERAKEYEQAGDYQKALEYAQNAELNAKIYDTIM